MYKLVASTLLLASVGTADRRTELLARQRALAAELAALNDDLVPQARARARDPIASYRIGAGRAAHRGVTSYTAGLDTAWAPTSAAKPVAAAVAAAVAAVDTATITAPAKAATEIASYGFGSAVANNRGVTSYHQGLDQAHGIGAALTLAVTTTVATAAPAATVQVTAARKAAAKLPDAFTSSLPVAASKVSERARAAIARAKRALAQKKQEAAANAAMARSRPAELTNTGKTITKPAATPTVTTTAQAPTAARSKARGKRNSTDSAIKIFADKQQQQQPEVPAAAQTRLRTRPGATIPSKPSHWAGFWTGFAATLGLVLVAVGLVAGGIGYMVMGSLDPTVSRRRVSLTAPSVLVGRHSSISSAHPFASIRCRRQSSGFGTVA